MASTDDPKVVKFYPADAAKNPDNVLEQAMGVYTHVLVLGWRDDDGTLDARASTNLNGGADTLWLLENFKTKLLNGDYAATELHDD